MREFLLELHLQLCNAITTNLSKAIAEMHSNNSVGESYYRGRMSAFEELEEVIVECLDVSDYL